MTPFGTLWGKKEKLFTWSDREKDFVILKHHSFETKSQHGLIWNDVHGTIINIFFCNIFDVSSQKMSSDPLISYKYESWPINFPKKWVVTPQNVLRPLLHFIYDRSLRYNKINKVSNPKVL